jgi:two-component sensor histidine kinase
MASALEAFGLRATMSTDTFVQIEAASSLAVIDASFAPLVLLDGEFNVIAASASFCDTFEIDPSAVTGRPMATLGRGEWKVPRLASLLRATASGSAEIKAYEMDLIRDGREPRRLVLNAHKLEYDQDNVRVLLAVVDVTDARAAEKLKDDLLREKAILLQEVQHRVANSLQIIASVLMQSARRMQSDEARSHLHDARQRVLSIAAVQRQLAATSLEDVALRPYLTELCDSLGASMIHDHDQISIGVKVDDSSISANASISIGLIVTELVINALKHAFPQHRHGKINVSYAARGPSWTLTVSDDGIGMPGGVDPAKPGLGTGIVQALVGQLKARISVTAAPGTTISISNEPEPHLARPDDRQREPGDGQDRGSVPV